MPMGPPTLRVPPRTVVAPVYWFGDLSATVPVVRVEVTTRPPLPGATLIGVGKGAVPPAPTLDVGVFQARATAAGSFRAAAASTPMVASVPRVMVPVTEATLETSSAPPIRPLPVGLGPTCPRPLPLSVRGCVKVAFPASCSVAPALTVAGPAPT